MDDGPSKEEEGRGCSKQETEEETGWAGGEGTIQPFRWPDIRRPDGSTRAAPWDVIQGPKWTPSVCLQWEEAT